MHVRYHRVQRKGNTDGCRTSVFIALETQDRKIASNAKNGILNFDITAQIILVIYYLEYNCQIPIFEVPTTEINGISPSSRASYDCVGSQHCLRCAPFCAAYASHYFFLHTYSHALRALRAESYKPKSCNLLFVASSRLLVFSIAWNRPRLERVIVYSAVYFAFFRFV